MPATFSLECHILRVRDAWCSECWTRSAFIADIALVDPDTLAVLHRFSVRAACPNCDE